MGPPVVAPLDLKLVAWLYLLIGGGAIIHMVIAAYAGRPLVNAMALFLLLGWKILKLSPGWRRIAVVVTVAIPLAGLLMMGLMYLGSSKNEVKWIGFAQGRVVGIAVTVIMVALLVWAVTVLRSARTRALFGEATG